MIYLGSDHGGFDLKEKIKKWLTLEGLVFEDLGNTIYDKDDDYPFFARAVGEKVASIERSGYVYPMAWKDRPKGILICRSAVGMAIVANKVRGVRAYVAFQEQYAMQGRLHNDANILCLAGDFIEEHKMKKIIKTWLETEFSGEERHVRRIKIIDQIENQYSSTLNP